MTCKLNTWLLFFNMAALIALTSSKYDIEAAAFKHYGVSFYSVLNNFRRSSNYWKILNDKMEDIKMRMKDNEDYHKQFFVIHELRDIVDGILGIKAQDGTKTLRNDNKNSLGVNKVLRHGIRRFRPAYRRVGADLPMIVVNKTVVDTLESLPLMMSGGLERRTSNRIVDAMFNMTHDLINHLIESVGSYSVNEFGSTDAGPKAARSRKRERRPPANATNTTVKRVVA